jgi:hypothetical protein
MIPLQERVCAVPALLQRAARALESRVEIAAGIDPVFVDLRAVAVCGFALCATAEQGVKKGCHQGISLLTVRTTATSAFSQRYQSGFIRPSAVTSGMLASGIGGIGGDVVGIGVHLDSRMRFRSRPGMPWASG